VTGWETYVFYARGLDEADGICPWAFAAGNPGYVWLKEKFEAAVEDQADTGGVLSESISSAGHSHSTTKDARAAALAKILMTAMVKYREGNPGGPQKSGCVANFRGMRP
jgi:hypothetical protein